MGGNLFDNLVRLNASDFEAYQAEVCSWLGEKYPTFAPTRAYGAKESFGDLDIVVQKPKLGRQEFEQWLASKGVDPQTDISYNKDNISFKYKDFQTDLIFVSPEDFAPACFYYSFNDLSNLIGRVAHKFGVKFGWDGLSYQIRTESGHRAHKFVLSKDPQAIYDFLGYDYARWEQGFETLEDIFAFVVSSPFFDPTIFELENLNHINKTRLRKRQTFQKFLDWLPQAEHGDFHFSRDKSLYLVKIHMAFPEARFLNQLAEYADQARLHLARKDKFNGSLVMAWTGLNGKDIGAQVGEFKKHIEQAQHFDSYLDSHSAKEVASDFCEYYGRSQKQA